MLQAHQHPSFDVEFSLSIYNRTGKFFIGQLIIDSCDDILNDVYYWYYRSERPPQGLLGKAIGRLQHLQVLHNATGGPFSLLPRRIPKNPLLHIDPFTVLSTHLRAFDAVIIHDIGPVTHPDLFDPKTPEIYDMIYKEIAAVGPHVIFVSQATQRAFNEVFGATRLASQRVIYPHIRSDVSDGAATAVAAAGDRYLLMTGALGVRKNQIGAIKAFARSRLAASGVNLVLCGSNEPGHQNVKEAAMQTPGVVVLSYVSDSELRWLYANARGFVLPSLLEGFGMPVAEAIRFDLIPIVSAGTVLEEVAGEGALTVDPHDEAGLAAAMTRLIDMPSAERQSRCAFLRTAITRFSAEQVAGEWRAALSSMR